LTSWWTHNNEDTLSTALNQNFILKTLTCGWTVNWRHNCVVYQLFEDNLLQNNVVIKNGLIYWLGKMKNQKLCVATIRWYTLITLDLHGIFIFVSHCMHRIIPVLHKSLICNKPNIFQGNGNDSNDINPYQIYIKERFSPEIF
jgi:hypothetical protein